MEPYIVTIVRGRDAIRLPNGAWISDLQMIVDELNRLHNAIGDCLDKNRHLADGDNCTLIDLKKAIRCR